MADHPLAIIMPIPASSMITVVRDPFAAVNVYELLSGKSAFSAVPDTTAPVVSNFSPVEGTTLDPSDSVEFDVTDNSDSFARNMIAVAFADGTQELAYDGLTFTARYLAASTASVITGGFHYTLRRTGGWPGDSLTVRAFSTDAEGNNES